MQSHDFIILIGGGLLSVISYFVKGNLDKVKSLEEKYNSLHEFYVKKDDFKEFKDELWMKLTEIKEEIKAK